MYAARRRQKNVDNEAELFTPESDFDSMPARSQEKRQGLLNASGFALCSKGIYLTVCCALLL